MALDLNKIKSRLTQLQSKGKKNADGSFEKTDYTKYYFKPIIGEQTIRIVPFKTSPNYPFVTVAYHNDIIKKKYLALSNWGEKDPIVSFSEDLRSSDDKGERDMGYKLKPKERIFAQVLVRGQEHLGVRLWEFGREIEKELLKLFNNKNYGDISDINEGTDLTIEGVEDTFTIPGKKPQKYIKPSITPERNITPLADTQEEIDKYLNEQHDPLELPFQKRYTYDEIYGFLDKFLNPEGASEQTAVVAETPAPIGDEEGDSLDVSAEASDDLDQVFVEEEGDSEPPFVADPPKTPKNAISAASKRIVAKDKEEIKAKAVVVEKPVVKKTTVVAKKEEPKVATKVVAPATKAATTGTSNKDRFNALFPKK